LILSARDFGATSAVWAGFVYNRIITHQFLGVEFSRRRDGRSAASSERVDVKNSATTE
jgi:hypothetical protein